MVRVCTQKENDNQHQYITDSNRIGYLRSIHLINDWSIFNGGRTNLDRPFKIEHES
jgi:hypothetical protein